MFSSLSCLLPGVTTLHAIHVFLLANQCLKRIPTQVWNHPSLCSHLLSGVLSCKDLLPRFPKFQIWFPYFCDIFLLHLGCPPWDMVQRVLLDRMSEQPGLFHVFPSSRRLPFLLFVFLCLKTVVYVLSTFLVIYDRKASSVAVIPLEPEAEFYHMHFTR